MSLLSLPKSILEISLLPFLDWSSRVSLNMGSPLGHRCCLRFSKAEADYHDRTTIIETIRSRILLIEDTLLEKQIIYMRELFLMFTRPRYRFMIEMEPKFKRTVISKLAEHSNCSALKRLFHHFNKEHLSELARISRLVRKMLTAPVKWICGERQYLQNADAIIKS